MCRKEASSLVLPEGHIALATEMPSGNGDCSLVLVPGLLEWLATRVRTLTYSLHDVPVLVSLRWHLNSLAKNGQGPSFCDRTLFLKSPANIPAINNLTGFL